MIVDTYEPGVVPSPIISPSVDILLGHKEYNTIIVKRIINNKFETPLKIWQDAKGSLIVEYKGNRVVDERIEEQPNIQR